MEVLKMVVLAVAIAVGLTVQGEAQDRVPGGGETVTTSSGSPVVVYGQRSKCDKNTAPTFAAIVESDKAISQQPAHGTLSDGGTGERMSRSCNKTVPVRVVIYTPDSNFTGEDSVVFWGTDIITIVVSDE
jgi:hypothetical protein